MKRFYFMILGVTMLLGVLVHESFAKPSEVVNGTASARGTYFTGFGMGTFEVDKEINADGPAFGGITGLLEQDPGYVIGGETGLRFGSLSVGVELSYGSTDLDTLKVPGGTAPVNGEVGNFKGMVNVRHHFNHQGTFKPYVGAGAGGSLLNIEGNVAGVAVDEVEQVFNWQLLGGVDVNIFKDVYLGAGYRYMRGSDATFAGLNLERETHAAEGRLTFNF